MPWREKSTSYTFKESRKKKKIQFRGYLTLKSPKQKNCPHRSKQVNGTEQSKTGKLSRILSGVQAKRAAKNYKC